MFSDTTKQQKALAALQQLKMQKNDLDGYVATFKHLVKLAGYNTAHEPTIHIFSLGLTPQLLDQILCRDTEPTTFDEWVAAATKEIQKYQKREQMLHPKGRYQWISQQPAKPARYIHPND
jgi:hypothetical protein